MKTPETANERARAEIFGNLVLAPGRSTMWMTFGVSSAAVRAPARAAPGHLDKYLILLAFLRRTVTRPHARIGVLGCLCSPETTIVLAFLGPRIRIKYYCCVPARAPRDP